ncbi:NADH dehydrogenase [ubiquinone] 1 alpha subcomplex subunit 10, mitochondrial [Sparus aurata]|uniref:NADH dehydrogenase [ubiquinone] 1 alpha subcomplex subunit 10, mitochondrial n=1 Tax=Sparus aurata TaxID=8175 RepID=A0A0F6MX67_SPAAU|nr:NADH dehydrogenase [ubiquinone] 1 alpha subcomplex subunit 10, mitochondrial [Sparus aurata]AGV76778.1 NADH dehydrogenase [ubiquinone] 1 alpha subcomplex subunit 10 [Sparus aurata]ATN38404.1 mitochondrial NADH dehydrogenase [ubiquinone] 1 alpha subcomplex subunit 10 [Sparus aurata]
MALRVIRLVIPSGTTAFKSVTITQKAGVHTSSVRSLRYGWLAYALGERTTPRLKQYSKIISVEGNLASGKGALAQKLADKLGMLYMPEADTFYLDKMTGEKEPLPVDFNGMCSLEKFYTDPKAADGNSYRLQLWMYTMRLLQYADAVEHLLTTGQGVILERSPFSDMVFLEAMFKHGYIRKECVKHYNEVKGISIGEFLPPHLTIYVDLPAEEVQKKLKQSGKAYLQNVPLSYLKSIEDSYKKTFLPQISETTEVLAYDATQAQDVERVAEDIEYLKFDKGPWLEQDDVAYHHMRMFVEDKQRVSTLTHIPMFLPEISIGAHDYDEKFYAYRSLPGKKYARGYNTEAGDKYVWLK